MTSSVSEGALLTYLYLEYGYQARRWDMNMVEISVREYFSAFAQRLRKQDLAILSAYPFLSTARQIFQQCSPLMDLSALRSSTDQPLQDTVHGMESARMRVCRRHADEIRR